MSDVPHLRFPEFSGEWEMASLQDIAAINPKSDQLQNTFIYIDLEAVEKGELRKIQEIMREEAPSRAQRVINNNDILFQCVRPYQKNNYIHRILNTSNQQWVASTGYAQIRTTESPNYIYHLLNTDGFNRKVMVRCTGSSYPAINSEDLATIRFYYTPDKKEQFKISRLLDLIDERIATQNKIIEKLESLIRGIRNSLLYSDNGTPIRIGDILKERVEKTTVNNQHEILSSTVKGIFSQREYFSKDIASENNAGYKVIRLHDVVLSPQNLWMGNINYNDHFEVGIVSPSYKIFTIAEKYDKTFIASMLKTQRSLYNYMLVSEQGASIVRRNLNMEAFEQLVFKIPPYEKQCEIGRTMSTLRTRLAIANATRIAYGQQKQWLLRQMFI
ncbi:restriction endonuclease subunit S [Alistipes shahii WAL 8301]|nr:restriction endonuclease subunit S [Alistipes shahii]UWN67231.1 restriction endonuclease subunit S [Alistipes shahii WAL 8301]